MKCPNCGAAHKKRDGMICNKCRSYHFVLRPDLDEGWTDAKFLELISRASSKNTCYFTENQLYTAFCDRKPKISFLAVVIIAIISGIAAIAVSKYSTDFVYIFGTVALIFGVYAFYRYQTKNIPPSRFKFSMLLSKWISARNNPEKMITETQLHSPPPEWNETDIYDYGFERLLIVEHDLLVDLFVLNNFHAQERTLILSLDGYPDYLAPHLEKTLADNPQLPIYYLHDATNKGQRSINQIAACFPVLKNLQIIDLGLTPTDVILFKKNHPRFPAENVSNVKIDLIPYNRLSLMTATAMAQKITFAEAFRRFVASDSGAASAVMFDSFG